MIHQESFAWHGVCEVVEMPTPRRLPPVIAQKWVADAFSFCTYDSYHEADDEGVTLYVRDEGLWGLLLAAGFSYATPRFVRYQERCYGTPLARWFGARVTWTAAESHALAGLTLRGLINEVKP